MANLLERRTHLSEPQAGVAQVETIEDLVVVVPWGRIPVARKGHGVGALEVNHATIVFSPVGVLHRVVETVSVVCHDLDRFAPRTLRSGGLRVPNLTEERRLGPRLSKYTDPALAPGVPCDVAVVALHLVAFRIREVHVHLDHLVGGGIEPTLVVVRKPHVGQGGTAVHPVATVHPVSEGMPRGTPVLRLGKGETLLEDLLLRVEFAKARLVNHHRLAHLDIGRNQSVLSLLVLQGEHGPEPCRTLPSHRSHFAGKAILAREVGEVHASDGPRVTFLDQGRGGHGDVEVSQWVAGSVGVTPEPVQLVAIDRGVDAVTTENLGIEKGLLYGDSQLGSHAVVIKPGSGEPAKTFRQVNALDPNLGLPPGGCCQALALKTKAILGVFVAMARHLEEHGSVHQPWLVESDQSRVVGDVSHPVHGSQLYQRHPSVSGFIHRLDDERLSCPGCQGSYEEKNERNDVHGKAYFRLAQSRRNSR
jgi:hypothetical protein